MRLYRRLDCCMLLVLLALPIAVRAADLATPPCTDDSRSCLQKIAQTVSDGYIAHTGAHVPLAPGVNRTENGAVNARGETEVRDSFARATMVKTIRHMQFYVDTDRKQVLMFFLADIDMNLAQANGTVRAGASVYKATVKVAPGKYTLHEAGRIGIDHGKISQIEFIDHVQDGTGGSDGW